MPTRISFHLKKASIPIRIRVRVSVRVRFSVRATILSNPKMHFFPSTANPNHDPNPNPGWQAYTPGLNHGIPDPCGRAVWVVSQEPTQSGDPYPNSKPKPKPKPKPNPKPKPKPKPNPDPTPNPNPDPDPNPNP